MKRNDILETALKCVDGSRDRVHGKPENSFDTIADLWTAYLDKPLCATDVAAMLALLKIARIKTGDASNPGYLDNFVDLAGYAACGGELASKYCEGDSQ